MGSVAHSELESGDLGLRTRREHKSSFNSWNKYKHTHTKTFSNKYGLSMVVFTNAFQ